MDRPPVRAHAARARGRADGAAAAGARRHRRDGLWHPKRFKPGDRGRALGYVALANRLPSHRVDVALVDGRFRLACLLEVLPYLSKPPARPIALLHDYAPTGSATAYRFSEYTKALGFYDVWQQNGTLAALTPKRAYSRVAADARA